jgi:hypothetical protein
VNGADRPCVFIHTNHRQYLGAVVSQYSLRRNSTHADRFDVRILHTADFPFLREREGQRYLRDGQWVTWAMEDLQSFTPLRFMPPELMGYRGRAVVIDPDIFAVGDVWELLSRDMQGKAILCRPRGKPSRTRHMASSVMLLDCAKLTHWRVEQDFAALFDGRRDYIDWIGLHYEPRETIGLFEPEWNDFDRLTEETRLLHNTRRRTQPWKTGLPMDFRPARKRVLVGKPGTWLNPVRRRFFGDPHASGVYQRHPDPKQERFFFDLLRECVDQGIVDEARLRDEMQRNHLRHDALRLIDRSPHAAA